MPKEAPLRLVRSSVEPGEKGVSLVDMKPVMDAPECADYLGLTLWTFRRLVRQGIVPAARVGGRWRFLRSAIDEWLRDGGTAGRVVRNRAAVESGPRKELTDLGSVQAGVND